VSDDQTRAPMRDPQPGVAGGSVSPQTGAEGGAQTDDSGVGSGATPTTTTGP
jgi:hypothetical protein